MKKYEGKVQHLPEKDLKMPGAYIGLIMEEELELSASTVIFIRYRIELRVKLADAASGVT